MSTRRLVQRNGSDSAHPDSSVPRCSEITWEHTVDCRHCAVRQQALFAALRGSDFEKFFNRISRSDIRAGTVLYEQDDAGEAIYSVRSGMVKLGKQSAESTPRIVRLLGRGAAFGLEAIREGYYWHSAIAMTQLGLCRIPFEVVDDLQTHNPQIADRLILQWEKHVAYADRWITDLSSGPIEERLRHLIGLLVEVTGNGSNEIELPSVHDLAATLGVSVGSVSRAMADLKRSRVLTRTAPRIYRCMPGSAMAQQ